MNIFCKKKITLLLAATVLLLALAGCGKTAEKAETTAQTEKMIAEVPLQAKEGIETVLILYLENYDTAGDVSAFRNANRADFAMLMVIDNSLEKITSLQLNPDTIVPFTIPGTSEPVDMPLGEVYSYGSGGSDSCLNVTKAASKLLKGIKIDHYLTFTMDSIEIVNDMIGGVVPGGSTDQELAALTGAEAVVYFTQRDPEDIDNEIHMSQQRLYMEGLYEPFMRSAQNEDFLTSLSLRLGERMATGLPLSQLIQMFERMAVYSMDEEILTLPGSATVESGQISFFPDEAALDRTVEALFLEQ